MKNQVEELKEIGMNIVRLRHARGITQEKLAEAAGVCDVYMRSIEHGRANVSYGKLVAIAKALDVPVYMFWLLSCDDDTLLTRFHQARKGLQLAEREPQLPVRYRYGRSEVMLWGRALYGLRAEEKREGLWEPAAAAAPFSEDGAAVAALAERCTACQLSPEHLDDVVHDYLNQEERTPAVV